MIDWRIHHRAETASTNLDARSGVVGDVFTADFQTAGRGRLDHKWLSPPRTNLMMSAVLSVDGLSPETISTLPLVVGLAVATGIAPFARETQDAEPQLKWPNDVWIGGKKVAGILCERLDERVIAGIGVNVGKQVFPPEICARATFLGSVPIETVRDRVLEALGMVYETWRDEGFDAVYPKIRAMDALRGRVLSVRQTDDDPTPVRGLSNGILPDGSLDVGGVCIYAGEAHVEEIE